MSKELILDKIKVVKGEREYFKSKIQSLEKRLEEEKQNLRETNTQIGKLNYEIKILEDKETLTSLERQLHFLRFQQTNDGNVDEELELDIQQLEQEIEDIEDRIKGLEKLPELK